MNNPKTNYEPSKSFEQINPVKVHSVLNRMDAELIMGVLKNNNIPCFIKSNETGSYMNITMGYSVFGEDIYVDEKDYQTALDLINSLSLNEEQNEEDEDEIDYAIPFYKKPQFVARIIIVTEILIMIMIYLLVKYGS